MNENQITQIKQIFQKAGYNHYHHQLNGNVTTFYISNQLVFRDMDKKVIDAKNISRSMLFKIMLTYLP